MENKEANIKFLIVDDHELLLEGIKDFVKQHFPNSTIKTASNHREIVQVLGNEQVDILLLDLMLGDEDSRSFLSQLIKLQPEMKIVVISSLEEKIVVNLLLQNGAHGFVGKSSPTIYVLEAIQSVLSGKTYIDPILKQHIENKSDKSKNSIILTRREKEVLRETLKGKKLKEIGNTLNISAKTVENHRANLFIKFDVRNVIELAQKAMLLGINLNHDD